MNPALLVIDVQNASFQRDAVTRQSLEQALPGINQAIDLFHATGRPVFAVQYVLPGEGQVPGAPGFDLPEQLHLLPGDRRIHKTYGNAFNKTPLADALCRLGVDTVILTGYSAECCVLATYRGARDHDLAAVVLRGALE